MVPNNRNLKKNQNLKSLYFGNGIIKRKFGIASIENYNTQFKFALISLDIILTLDVEYKFQNLCLKYIGNIFSK